MKTVEVFNNQVGELFAKARLRQNLAIEDISRALGLPAYLVERIEREPCRVPLCCLHCAAGYLGITGQLQRIWTEVLYGFDPGL